MVVDDLGLTAVSHGAAPRTAAGVAVGIILDVSASLLAVHGHRGERLGLSRQHE